ncbi:aromatic-ring-hydroxylating dioxygenase subunit beta [Nitriliruptoraceae bacterium ZYF776]|nr:aromatic-ring-hydroxylating dioxygenase subunit beta [Profundirhabdus halotolerans]
MGTRIVTRAEVEDFLIHEAHLLDTWDLDGWLALFAPGAVSEVTTTDWEPGWQPSETGSFVYDDEDLLHARVKRLKSRKAHAENPHSRTHRIVGNVRVEPLADDRVRAAANFLVHRYRDGAEFVYAGRYDHELAVTGTGLAFVWRRAIPTNESMAAGARLSFIL